MLRCQERAETCNHDRCKLQCAAPHYAAASDTQAPRSRRSLLLLDSCLQSSSSVEWEWYIIIQRSGRRMAQVVGTTKRKPHWRRRWWYRHNRGTEEQQFRVHQAWDGHKVGLAQSDGYWGNKSVAV